MVIIEQRITIIKQRRPVRRTLNEELQWFGDSLGLFGERDKDRSCFRVFIELLNAAKKNLELSSDEIAHKTHLSRGTVIHHINKLIESGLIVHEGNRYMLRVGSLEAVVEEIEKDLHRTCADLKRIANAIDNELGL